MTHPISYTGFVQKQQDEWLVFKVRDDVEEHLGYWALRSDNKIEYVSGLEALEDKSDTSRFGHDEFRTSGPRLGLFGTPLFRDKLIGDPLSGRSEGQPTSPQVQARFRQHLIDMGFKGAGVTNALAMDILEAINQVELGLLPGEDLHTEYFASLWAQADGDAGRQEVLRIAEGLGINPRSSKIKNHPILGGDDALDLIDQEANVDQRFPGFGTDVSMVDTEVGPSPLPQHAGERFADEAGGSGTGSFLGDDAQGNIFDPNGTTGVGDNREELRRFVDSDFKFAFNAMLNTFRDSGTSRIFVEWLTQQFPRFIGEFEGQQAQMAIEGTVPGGTFGGMLQQKGLLGPEYADRPGAGPSRLFSEFVGGQTDGDPALADAPVGTDEELAPRTALDEVRGGGSSAEFTDLIVGSQAEAEAEAVENLR